MDSQHSELVVQMSFDNLRVRQGQQSQQSQQSHTETIDSGGSE